MSYKKKKDAMTKEQLQQEIEWQKVEIKRLERRLRNAEIDRDEALRQLGKVPDGILRFFLRKK